MTEQFTLSKNERLKSRKAIDNLFREGRRFSITPFRIFYTITKTEGLQFGTGASSKIFKRAVDRNRIKRLTREAYRVQKNELKTMLTEKGSGINLFIIYTGKEIPPFKLVYDKVKEVLNKLMKITNENPAAHS